MQKLLIHEFTTELNKMQDTVIPLMSGGGAAGRRADNLRAAASYPALELSMLYNAANNKLIGMQPGSSLRVQS